MPWIYYPSEHKKCIPLLYGVAYITLLCKTLRYTVFNTFLKQFIIYWFLGDGILLDLSHWEDQEKKLGKETWRRKEKLQD